MITTRTSPATNSLSSKANWAWHTQHAARGGPFPAGDRRSGRQDAQPRAMLVPAPRKCSFMLLECDDFAPAADTMGASVANRRRRPVLIQVYNHQTKINPTHTTHSSSMNEVLQSSIPRHRPPGVGAHHERIGPKSTAPVDNRHSRLKSAENIIENTANPVPVRIEPEHCPQRFFANKRCGQQNEQGLHACVARNCSDTDSTPPAMANNHFIDRWMIRPAPSAVQPTQTGIGQNQPAQNSVPWRQLSRLLSFAARSCEKEPPRHRMMRNAQRDASHRNAAP